MKKWLWCLLSMLCASAALAEPPAPAPAPAPDSKTRAAASALVKKRLIQPLAQAQQKRSRFSRSAPVPTERRVRVLDTTAQTDVHGKHFVRFAVDERLRWDDDSEWEMDAILGCAYLDQKEVFVKRGEDYVPASNTLGKDGKARSDVCRAAPGNAGELAQRHMPTTG
jgi:hypothetical protein